MPSSRSFPDEVASVVALVGAERLVSGRQSLGHGQRRQPFGRARSPRQFGSDGELAQAWISVPSTEKGSSESSPLICA
jgi:hypothetical protein